MTSYNDYQNVDYYDTMLISYISCYLLYIMIFSYIFLHMAAPHTKKSCSLN